MNDVNVKVTTIYLRIYTDKFKRHVKLNIPDVVKEKIGQDVIAVHRQFKHKGNWIAVILKYKLEVDQNKGTCNCEIHVDSLLTTPCNGNKKAITPKRISAAGYSVQANRSNINRRTNGIPQRNSFTPPKL